MAKKEPDWEFVQILFEAGNKLPEIEKKTGVNKGSVSRKAKKEGWERGSATSVIHKAVDVEEFKATLSNQKLHVFNDEVDRQFKDKQMIENLARVNLSGVAKHIKIGELDVMGHKIVQETIHKAGQTLGVVQQFANTTINNTNAQQTTLEETMIKMAEALND